MYNAAAAAGIDEDAAGDDADRASRGRKRRRSAVASRHSTSAASDRLSDFVCSTGDAWRTQHALPHPLF